MKRQPCAQTNRRSGEAKRARRTSRRSVREGMSHRIDLSRRPGRSSAGSIRSGRLCDTPFGVDGQSPPVQNGHRLSQCEVDARSGRENVDAVESLGTVHLRQHLVDDPVRHAGRVVPTATRADRGRLNQRSYERKKQASTRGRRTAWARSSQTRRRRARKASLPERGQTGPGRSSRSRRCTC